jgi:hypothetical protein
MPEWLSGRGLLKGTTEFHSPNPLPNIMLTADHRIMKQEPDQVKLEEAKATLGGKLDVYEQILSKQKYLAGDVCTCLCPIHIAALKVALFLGRRSHLPTCYIWVTGQSSLWPVAMLLGTPKRDLT